MYSNFVHFVDSDNIEGIPSLPSIQMTGSSYLTGEANFQKSKKRVKKTYVLRGVGHGKHGTLKCFKVDFEVQVIHTLVIYVEKGWGGDTL